MGEVGEQGEVEEQMRWERGKKRDKLDGSNCTCLTLPMYWAAGVCTFSGPRVAGMAGMLLFFPCPILGHDITVHRGWC